MQKPTPMTVQSPVIEQVIVIFMEHTTYYFLEKKRRYPAFLGLISRAQFNSFTVLEEKQN